ncbi:MAG TPA: AI-2E family transporter [Vicinamibacterales bacterium]|nr:AI-2E family transporter [Vicinamibacterales bacterium]
MISDREFTRRLLQTVATLAGAVILVYALWEARAALMLVYVSALIAMGFSPIVRVIEGTHSGQGRLIPRWLAILSVYLVVVAILVLLGLAVVPPLVAQAASLWDRAPAEFNKAQTFLLKHRLMTRRVTFEQAVENAPSGAGANAVGTVLVAISTVVGGIFGFITILILSFYFLVEANAMFEYLIRFVPGERRAAVSTAARQAVVKVSAWLRAQFVLAATMGMFVTAGMWWMGVPYFYVLALVAAIGETIPVVGPIIGGITAVAVALSVSPKLALMCGVYFLVLHQLEANVLVPKIMEKRVGVSPVAVLVALLVGGELYGLIGAILAIPTAAILSVIVEEIAAGQEAVRIQRVR